MPFEQSPGRRIAGACRGALRHDANDGHAQGTGCSEAQWIEAAPATESIRKPLRANDHQTGKQPAGQARNQRHQQARPQQTPGERLHPQAAKVGLVAEHGHGHKAGQHNADDHQRALRHAAPSGQLLQREDDATQRGVEGGRNSRCSPSHHQIV